LNSKAKRSQQVKNNRTINHLRFSNISFKHQSAASYAVQDISEAQAGETIAFVGPRAVKRL
jgi:ATP-binding cassette subfamily B protein